MSNNENSSRTTPDEKTESSRIPNELPSPKRGAFPTPKEEIERAKPYIPHPAEKDGQQPIEFNSLTNDKLKGE